MPHAGQSASDTEGRLLALTDEVATALGLTWEPARDPGRGRTGSRGDFIRYPGTVGRGIGVSITPDAVLLETRVGDGREPSEMADISTIIGRWTGLDVADYDDLAPFRIPVLEPRRTLIEKLVAVHHAMATWTEADPPNQHRFGRHYYAIFCLLGHRPTLRRLTDRAHFDNLLADIERISDRYYNGRTSRPAGGFADSPAFVPERGTPARAWLEESYAISLRLVSPAAQQPGFGSVLKRVAEKRELL